MSIETNTNANVIQLLAKHLGCCPSEIEEARFDCHGLTVFDVGRESYAVGTDEECQDALTSHVKDSVWSFRGEFVAQACGLPSELGEVFSGYCAKECESANDAMLGLVKRTCGLERFVELAESADGRGHFLASYDGDEIELGEGLFAYRIA